MKKFLVVILAAFMCIGMAACTPSSVEKAEEKMQEAGYKVVAYSKDAEGMVGGFVASKGITDVTNTMTAILFETKDDATDFYSNISETGAVLDGKWVYWGAEEAIDEFTGF